MNIVGFLKALEIPTVIYFGYNHAAIFSQSKSLILSVLYVHKESVISFARVALGTKTNIVFFYVNRVDGQKFTRNGKNNLEISKFQNYLDIILQFLSLNDMSQDWM